MFIACDGLSILVSMLDENYEQGKDIIWLGVDCVSRVFELQVSFPCPRKRQGTDGGTGTDTSKRFLSTLPRFGSFGASVGRVDLSMLR